MDRAGRCHMCPCRPLIPGLLLHPTITQVVTKEDDYTLYESLGRYVAATVQPHLILMSSNNLCKWSGPSGGLEKGGQCLESCTAGRVHLTVMGAVSCPHGMCAEHAHSAKASRICSDDTRNGPTLSNVC